MKTIKDVYKIGVGPSSSHSMGPFSAAVLFKKENEFCDNYKVILYGSLAKTGKGHGTDTIIKKAFYPKECEVIFSTVSYYEMKHPNTLDFIAYKDGEEKNKMRVYSVGGGDIIIENREQEYYIDELYKENTFTEIKNYCLENHLSLAEYVYLNEKEDIKDYLMAVWETMKNSIHAGLNKEGILPGGINIQRKAKYLYNQTLKTHHPEVLECQQVCSYAYAVSEENADNGVIVTAPTCGSAGVLPAVLYYLYLKRDVSDKKIIDALAVAGLFGSIVKENASVSGAEAGCQAEIGVACAMAAGACGVIFNYSLDQIEYAAEIALEHHLGLTCDPVCGLVQVPCIERNAVAAMRALNSCNLAFFLSDTRRVSFDMVVKSMYQTGLDMNGRYRETSEGGLAEIYQKRGWK